MVLDADVGVMPMESEVVPLDGNKEADISEDDADVSGNVAVSDTEGETSKSVADAIPDAIPDAISDAISDVTEMASET